MKSSVRFSLPIRLCAVGFLFQILGWSISRGERRIWCGSGQLRLVEEFYFVG